MYRIYEESEIHKQSGYGTIIMDNNDNIIYHCDNYEEAEEWIKEQEKENV
jgi:hypothetical protein